MKYVAIYEPLWRNPIPPDPKGVQAYYMDHGSGVHWSDDLAAARRFEGPDTEHWCTKVSVIVPIEDAALWDELRRL